jgi:hypothetical protein
MNQLSSVYFLFKVPLNISFYFFKNSGATSHVINSRTFIKRRRYQNVLLCSAVLYRQTLGFFFLKVCLQQVNTVGLLLLSLKKKKKVLLLLDNRRRNARCVAWHRLRGYHRLNGQQQPTEE